MPDKNRITISASEAPALLDASPYITRWLLYQRFAFGEEISSPTHNRMDWGKKLEPLILEAAADELHLEVIPNRDDAGEQAYISRGIFGCTRDATIIDPQRGAGALETKCVFDYGVWMRDWDGGRTPPRHVEIQLQVQMMVGDGDKPFSWGKLAVWLAGEIHYFEREPIPELWTRLGEEAAAFFASLEQKRPPDPFGSPVEMPLLAKIFPTLSGTVLELDDAGDRANIAKAEIVRMFAWHQAERAGHDKAADKLKAELLALALEHETVKLPHGIAFKVQRQQRAGYTVQPSTVTIVKPFVPKNLPEGAIAL